MMDAIRTAFPGQTVWDRGEKASVTGLHVRVKPDGQKSFFLYYRTRDGRQRRPKIGDLGPTTLTDARKRARALLDQVAVGVDPKAEWDEKKAELTIYQLFNKVWRDHWDTPRFQRSGWAAEVWKIFSTNIDPLLGTLKLSELAPIQVRAWHKKFEDRPYSGNRALSVLSKLFSFAEEQQLRPQNSNPCALVKSFPERKRKRFATEAEIKLLHELLELEVKQHPAGVAFLYLLMFSGSRPRFIERATWDQLHEFQVNGERWGVLTLAGKTTEKTGDDERVILPPQAMEALARLPRIKGATITGIKLPRKLWYRVREKAGCDDLWARDWRRTYATVGNSDGVDFGAIGSLLNHKSRTTTDIYAKVMDTKQFTAAAQIADKLSQIIAGGESPSSLA